MSGLNSQPEINNAVAKYGLSDNAALNSLQTLPWDSLEKLFSNLWSSDNPDGLVFLGVAENPLLHQEVAQYITSNFSIDPTQHLGYGVGPRGSPRLRKALAAFLNLKFHAHEPVHDAEVLVLPGVISVLDALTWAVCNEGEGIIVPLPYYTGFVPATKERSRGVLIPAPFQPLDGYKGIDEIFDPEMNRKSLEAALEKAACEGVKARAVLLSNPHNPIGRCYPKKTLREIARFCGRNGLHLISDEIFAQSVYQTPNVIDPMPFNSILSLDLTGCIDRQFVHVAYGMSKDYSANGFRLAALHSRNEALLVAVTSICVFSWAPYITQDMWAKMLEDDDFSLELASKNRKLLSEHYTIITHFLDAHEISYYRGTNAGCFVWVDLRSYLRGSGETVESTSLSTHKLSSPDLEMYQDREKKLSKRCIMGGVGISAGSSYFTEELGWFRITFTVEKEALLVGLKRMLKCLQEIKADGWES